MNDIRMSEDPALRKIVYILGIMGVIVLGFYTARLLAFPMAVLFDILSPFLVGGILAYILAPMVMAIQRRLRLGRLAGTLLVFFIILAIFFLVLAVAIPLIIFQLLDLVEALREAIPRLIESAAENRYLGINPEMIKDISEKLGDLKIDYEKILGSALPALKSITTGGLAAVGGVFKGLWSVFGLAGFLAFVAIIIFYLILDWEKIGPFVRRAIPPQYQTRTFEILGKMDVAVGGFLRGQLTVSLIVGVCFAVGLLFIGLLGFPALRNFSLLIGTAAGIGGFIPYLGPIIGVTPALIIVLLSGGVGWTGKLIAAAVVLGLFMIIQAIEGLVLQPRIVGKGAGLHPLAVMLALVTGAYFGITGMIVAVPAASIIRVLLREFYWVPMEKMLPGSRILKT